MEIFRHILRIAASFWVGGVAIFTFVLTPIIFKVNDRDTAGRIVGTLFPGYFKWGLACGAIGLFSILLARGKNSLTIIILLIVMLSMTAFQAFYIEPRATELKRQIPSFISTPKDDPLRKEFSRLHGISAICNLTVFGSGVIIILMM
jgi:hypothetical protein